VSPYSLSLSVGRWGIWNFMLERDEARRLHSNFAHVVVQPSAHVDYLHAALLVVEEEVVEAPASATIMEPPKL
jgi:hypothetical protein